MYSAFIGNIRAQTEGGMEIALPMRVARYNFPSVYRFLGERNVQITDKGQMTAFICFLQGPLEGKIVEPTLIHYVETVSNVRDGFRALFPFFA
jgi:hypothetical protein